MLVVGVGNPDRGDDGIGPWLADRLGECVDATSCRGETTELMDLWAEHDDVVVVDAMRSGVEPGTVRRFDAHDGPFPTQAFNGSTHNFGLAEAIELSRALGTLPKRLIVYGIEGECFQMGAAISPAVLAAGDELLQELTDA